MPHDFSYSRDVTYKCDRCGQCEAETVRWENTHTEPDFPAAPKGWVNTPLLGHNYFLCDACRSELLGLVEKFLETICPSE